MAGPEPLGDLTVVFTSHSRIEADVVHGLLDAHGIQAVLLSEYLRAVFPVNVSGLSEVRVAVRSEEAEEARRLIESHRQEPATGQVVPLRDEFGAIERRIGYRFIDRGLIEHALTHRSRAHEDASGGVLDNESLEFLGDAVLGFVIADVLFHEFPTFSEGQKSKIKAMLVSTAALAKLGQRISLGDELLLGRGEEKSGGRRKQALIANAFEALIAAVYLDGGVEAVRTFLLRQFRDLIDEVHERGIVVVSGDHKSALQEWLQSRNRPLPEYRVASTRGPDHRKLFEVEVLVGGRPVARAEGRNKKEAEQQAAQKSLVALKAGTAEPIVAPPDEA